jgi:hypothetical protein
VVGRSADEALVVVAGVVAMTIARTAIILVRSSKHHTGGEANRCRALAKPGLGKWIVISFYRSQTKLCTAARSSQAKTQLQATKQAQVGSNTPS